MGDWREATLGELYEFSSGLSKPRSEFGAGYPFLSFKDVFYNTFVPTKLTSLVKSDERERERCSISRGDVFLTRTSETMDELGMSCVALRDVPNATFNGFTKRLRPITLGSVVPEYAGYYFRSPRFRLAVNSMSSMSTRASLNNEMLARLRMTLPPLRVQEAIGSTLKALDDKIELNRRMNETLEAMARAIFKDWFVDFGPTCAKMESRAPYLAPDIWSLFPERLDDEGRPEGWRGGPMSELVEIAPTEPMKKGELKPYLDMAALPTEGSSSDPAILREYSSGTRFRNGDTLLARITPCLENGKTAFVQNLPPDTVGWGSTEFIVMRSRPPVPKVVSYLIARDPTFRRHAIQSMTGTSGRQRANADAIAAYPVVLPSNEKLWDAITEVATPTFEKIAMNTEESLTLAATRDLLLPKLMSGEIRVKDAETLVGEVA